MNTRMTELLGIKYPIMLAGMAYVSLPELVAAVSNGGGIGTFNSAATPPEEIRDVIKQIRSLTDKPFAINVTLMLPDAREKAEIVLEEKVPVINYALGKADWLIKATHEYGGKVLATVATERHARKAEQDGADALVVTGTDAAAHGPVVTTLVLMPLIASQVKIPVIAAGGFCDGKGLVAALALGSDGISMGTRFMLTKESKVHERIKDVLIEAKAEDTIYSDKIDGMPGRWFKTDATLRLASGELPLMKSNASVGSVQQERGIQDPALQVLDVVGIQIAVDTGDLESGFVPVGQVISRIDDIPTCSEVIDRIVAEAKEAIEVTRAKAFA